MRYPCGNAVVFDWRSHRNWKLLLLIGCLLPFSAANAAEPNNSPRTWTSADGKFSVKAQMIESSDMSVRLKTADGRIVSVPVSKLSPSDQEFIAGAPSPIPAGPMAPTREAFLKTVQSEELRTPSEYAEHTKDPPELHERGKEYLTLGVTAKLNLPIDLNREQLHAMGAKLIEDGSTDPLIIALNLQTVPNFNDFKEIEANCTKAMKDVVEIYEPRQQLLVIQWCQSAELALSQALWDMRRRKLTKYNNERSSYDIFHDAHVRWLESEADSLDQQRYMWHIMTEFYLNPVAYHGHGLIEVAKRSRDKKIHPWMRHMLDARATYEEGREFWLKDDVKFEDFYREASKDYLAAWKIAPQFPEASTELLQHSRGGFVEGTPRLWFDWVMLAEIDHPMAFTYYRTHLRGQGVDALIAFGEECAATERYDTKLPFEMIECVWAAENHTGENVWKREGVYEKIRDMCQGALKAPKYIGEEQNEHTRAWINGTQLILAARANRLEDVPALWDKTNMECLQQLARVHHLNMPLASLKAAAAAAASEPTRLVNVVEKSLAEARDEAGLELAAKQIDTAAAQLEADNPRVAQWRAALALYKDFYADRWATVTFAPKLPELAGVENWTREDEHTLVARGCGQLTLEDVSRLPGPIEISIEINTLEMPAPIEMAGMMIGPPQPIPNQHGRGDFFGVNGKTREAAIYHYVLQKYTTAPFKETNELRVRAWHGYREFFVNGERMNSSTVHDFRPDSHFSLAIAGPEDARPHVRFSNLKVRRLDFGPPPNYRKPTERIEYYTARLKDEPDIHWHRLDRADAHFALDDMGKALEDYDELLKTHEKWQHVILQKGIAHAALGDYAKAFEQYTTLLGMPSVEVGHVKSVTFDRDGKRIENHVTVRVFHVKALDQLAWLEATCSDAEFRNGKLAVEHAERALELGQDQHREVYLTLAAAYAEAGDFDKARGAMKKAEQLAGENIKGLIGQVKAAIDSGKPYREPTK